MEKYEYVESIMKEHNGNFYKAFSELPPEKARAIYSIYAFYRATNDAVEVDNDLEKINTLKRKLKATFEDDAPDDLLFKALEGTLKTFPASIDPYMDLLDAMRDDYYNKPIETEEAFDKYITKAGGSIGLMLMPIIAKDTDKKDEKQLKAVCTELGKAIKITNIIRDVREDFMNQRIYFPDEVIEKQQLQIEITITGLVTAEWRSMMEYYIDMAKEKYHIFFDHADLFDKDAIYPTYLAASFYENTLDVIQKKNYTNINKSYNIGAIRKFFITKQVKHKLKKQGLM